METPNVRSTDRESLIYYRLAIPAFAVVTNTSAFPSTIRKESWPITNPFPRPRTRTCVGIAIKTEQGEAKTSGLFRVDEAALNAAPADDLVELRRTGALMMAYCQLFSSQHLAVLGRPAAARPTASLSTTDNGFQSDNGTIGFGALRKGSAGLV